MMKKRIAFLLVLAALFTLSGCGNSASVSTDVESDANQVYELKIGHIQPADHPNGQGAEEFASLVEEKTDGHVKVSVFPSSQLGNEQELFDAVALGSVAFAIIGFGEPAKQYSPFLLLDAPYLASSREQWVKIMKSDAIAEMCREMEEITSVKALGVFYYGARYVTSNFPVRSPADLAGHTIRVPDQQMYVSTMNAMGATATPMALSEVFLGLQQNVIDGQENPVATISANKFNEVQTYLNKTEHIMGGNCIYASNKVLDALPEAYRTAVLEAGSEASDYINDLAFQAEDTYAQELQDKGMILIDDVDKEAFQQATACVYEELGENWTPELLERIRAVQ